MDELWTAACQSIAELSQHTQNLDALIAAEVARLKSVDATNSRTLETLYYRHDRSAHLLALVQRAEPDLCRLLHLAESGEHELYMLDAWLPRPCGYWLFCTQSLEGAFIRRGAGVNEWCHGLLEQGVAALRLLRSVGKCVGDPLSEAYSGAGDEASAL